MYNQVPYTFLKNLQGDVIAIADKNGNTVARYEYDAWGVCTVTENNSADIAAGVNPFRYRGYYYDAETGLYCLQSRYYDAGVGRWLNSDILEVLGLLIISKSISDATLFLYCSNNPTNDKDITGYISANKIANMFSISTFAVLAMPILYVSYEKGLLAVGIYVTEIVTPIALKAFWWKPLVAAAIIVATVAIIVSAVGIYFSKQSKKSGKERASNPPGWVASAMNAMPPHGGEKAKDYARRLMDYKYGRGNWKQGASTEYNKIVMYLTRHIGMS